MSPLNALSARSVRAAFIFLTRIPVGGGPYSEEDWRRSTGHFPLVGLVLGALLGALAMWLLPHLGAWPTALITLAVSAMLTGGFHEDGLADSADALGGAFDREKLFLILKDSRLGSYGVLALVLSVGLRAALLAELGPGMPGALVLTQCVARMPPIALMRAMPYVTADSDAGEAKSRLVARATRSELIMASVWAGGVLAMAVRADALHPGRALALVLVLALGSVACARRFQVRAGGVTGDFLGATEQVCECLALAVLVWR